MQRAKFTAKERAERYKVQRERHNAKRKEEREDPARRQEINEMNRRNYQARANVETFDCRASLSQLGEIGTVRHLLDPYSGPENELTFTLEELAKAIGRELQALYRWQRKDLIPRPIMRAEVENNNFGRSLPSVQYVFTRPEVEALLNAFGEHTAKFTQYRAAHVATREAIFKAVEAVRSDKSIKLVETA